MDSLGKRAAGARAGWDADRSSGSLAGTRSYGKWLLRALAWLLVLYVAVAQATSYVYDANGRLVAVTKDDGTSAQYSYDALGNLLQISTVPAGQLTLFAFSPTHGTVGTPVTLYGQGFGSTPGSNSVSFNGTAAAVSSATTTQLQVQVPAGASTGPITVTTGGQSVSSAMPFTVDDTGLPPVITQVSPITVAVGDTVTVSGAHLQPMPKATDVRLGSYPLGISALSNTQLQFVVPKTASSGHVSVQTPYGQAVSAETVLVLPSGLSAANMVSRGYATVDSAPVNLTIGAAGQVGAVMFDAVGGSWLSLQASAIATSATNINYKVYAPGNVLIQQGAISATSPSIHLPRLAKSGTYLATFQPDTAGAQLSVGVESNAALITNTLATVATTVPGQSKRVLFNAKAGQTLAFYVAGATSTPANQAIGYTVYSPSGASYTSATTSNSGTINLNNLPTTGTYQVVVVPGGGATTTAQVEIVPGVVGQLPPDGTSQTFNANAPGQNIYFNFTAQQGDSYQLTLTNASVTGASNNGYQVVITNSSGAQVLSNTCYQNSPGGNCDMRLWYLPAGTYTVTVLPTYGGTLHFNTVLLPSIIGPDLSIGNTASLSIGTGQWERLTFNANAGDTIALQVSAASTGAFGQPIRFRVYRPDAGAITTSTPVYTSFDVAGSQVVNLPNLPIGGTYVVIVCPFYGLAGTAQFSVVPGVTGQVSSDGTSQTFNANAPGQNVYFNFTAQQGDSYQLTLTNASVTGASNNGYQVVVTNSSGAQVLSNTCYQNSPGGNCDMRLWYLPADTYSVTVVPTYGGTLHFNAILMPPLIGPNLVPGSTTSLTLGAGQWERLTFNANAGDTVALQVAGAGTTAFGQPVRFQVFRPDVGAITTGTPIYTTIDVNGSQLVNLPNLPVSGTYTVIAFPFYGLPGSVQLSLVPGVTGQVPSDGTTQTFNANAPGQNVYFNFTAQQGDYLELTLTGVSTPGASNSQYQVYVYNASGTQVANATCSTGNPAGNCNLDLWYLMAGQYSVTVVPTSGGTLHFGALLTRPLIGPNLTLNSATNIVLGTGQWERLTFNANAGDTVALQVSGITTTPAGQPLQVLVYRPDTGAITKATPWYAGIAPTSSQLVNLPNLPVSGTYTVLVNPYFELPTTAQLSLTSGVTGQVPVDGATQVYNANTPGQNVYFNFTAQQGDYLELTLTGVSIPGASSNQYQVYVYNASGAQVANATCSTGSPAGNCNLDLWYLPAGNYAVTVVPTYGGTLHFNAMVMRPLIGPNLTPNSTANIALGTGQWERLTFNANAGDTVALQVSGIATAPAGQPLQVLVYRPDTGAITKALQWYAGIAPTGSQLLNLSNLPVGGTYTVLVNPYFGLSATAQLSYVQNTPGTPPTYETPTQPVDGSPKSYSSGAAGQNVKLTFNANLGDNLELTFSDVSVTGSSNFTAYVYNAAGAQVTSLTCYTSTGPSCRRSLWNLPAGTYSVVAVPPSNGTVSFKAILQPDVIGPNLTMGVPTTVNLAAGQVQRLTFNANAGDIIAVQLSGASTVPAGQIVYVDINRPDMGVIGRVAPYSSFGANGSNVLNLPNLPVSGTYTAVVYTTSGIPATAQLTVLSGAGGALPTDGSPQTYGSQANNQNVYMTFNANLGDNLELTFSDVSVTGSSNFTANVYNVAGAQVTNLTCYTSAGPSCRRSLWNLPAGTYSVVAVPPSNGTVSFKAILQPDVIGPSLTIGIPTTVNLAAGQVQRLTFNANAGDTIAVQLSGAGTVPAGQIVYVDINRPDMGVIGRVAPYSSFGANGSNVLNLPNLPVSGTYTAVVYTTSGIPGSTQLTVRPAVGGTVPTDGTNQSYSTPVAYQNVYMTFNANLGDNLELTFSDVSVTGSNNFIANVYNAAGAQVTSLTCYTSTGPSCRRSLWNLPAGTYSIVATPPSNGTISFKAILQPDVIGPNLTMGVPTTVNLAAGQVQRLTFNANAGDTIAVQLSGASTVPAGQIVYVDINRPDMGVIGRVAPYSSFGANGSNVLNLPNLPVSGTYTAVVYTTSGIPSSTQLTVRPGVGGTVPTDGTSQSYSTPVAYQNVYMTFNANVGDNLELTLSDVSMSGSNNFTTYVYNAAGAQVASLTCSASTGPSCRRSLWNLPAGPYSMVAVPPSNGMISFKAILQPDVIGPSLTMDVPTTVNLAAGQVQRLTFDANAGDSIAVQLLGVSTVPAGQIVYVDINRPDMGVIGRVAPYSSFGAGNSNVLNLPNLPVSGTYTTVVYTTSGIPANAQLKVTRQ